MSIVARKFEFRFSGQVSVEGFWFLLPDFSQRKKWRFMKRIGEGELCTNAIIGYKNLGLGYRWISIYAFPVVCLKIFY